MTTVVVITAVLLVVGLIVVAALSNHPWQNTSTRDDIDHGDDTRSEQLYGKADRPAGPDVGPMDPERLGGDHRPPTTTN